ncbi:MAG TPA: hypothetical protein VJN02_08440 [Gammaproteobacteria bacterium]|nr:hypothetical protein [Gammaproteobacteria bacterium]
MKKLLLGLFCLLVACSVFAQENLQKNAFVQIKLDFNYTIPTGNKENQINKLQNITNIDINDKEWRIIGRSQSRLNGDILVLLAKLVQVNKEDAEIKFLVIDLSRQTDLTIETKMTMHYNKQERVTIKKQGRQLQLTVMAFKK